MVRAIKTYKGTAKVIVSFDDEGMRIDGDPNPAKPSKITKSVCCMEVSTGMAPDPTILPIDNLYILNATYLPRNGEITISCVLPEDRSVDQSPSELYEFRYTVDKQQRDEAESFCEELRTQAYKDLTPNKRLLVLINPFGGKGDAKKLFEYHVRPVFESANCKIEVIETKRLGHALEIAENLEYKKYDTIVTMSGDGIIHEVINGILKREDRKEVLEALPIAVLPGGTGNALSVSLLGSERGTDLIYTALQVIKGERLYLDLCSVTFKNNRYYSFLSQNYGISAYADLATEHLRWMGDARSTLGMFQEIMANKTYNIKASIQLVESNKETIKALYSSSSNDGRGSLDEKLSLEDTIPDLSQPVPEDWMTIEGPIIMFLASKVPYLAKTALTHPYALPHDGQLDLMVVRTKPAVGNIKSRIDMLNKTKTGEHLETDMVEYFKIKAFRLEPKLKAEEKSYLAIDGEHATVEPFQVQVHPNVISVLTINPSYVPINQK